MYFWTWPFRSRGQLDIPLDGVARQVRWIVVFLGGALSVRMHGNAAPEKGLPLVAAVHAIEAYPVASAIGYISLVFFIWPNLAYRLTTALRWARLLPPASPEYARTMRIHWGCPTDEDLEADRLAHAGPAAKAEIR
ncbi:MAG: hypothetical protein ACRD1E_11620 [Terriglobales bacterium]